MSLSAAIRIQTCLSLINNIDEQINILEAEIFRYVYTNHNREMKLLMSSPGVGEISAATIIAEVGDFNDFSSGAKLASWRGLVPRVYQSADK
ncbi:transposase [Methanosarcina siciliae HI350]|nr:transposase [Methanosarcina siciliae HI350]